MTTGKPTTDPDAALRGTMVPMGDAKGTALALMVELLAAGLTGANFAAEASSYLDAEGAPSGTGQLIMAFDPAAFGGDAPARFGLLAASIEAQPGARLPGTRRLEGAREGEGRGADDFRSLMQRSRRNCASMRSTHIGVARSSCLRSLRALRRG